MKRNRKKNITRRVVSAVAILAVVLFFIYGGTLLATVEHAHDHVVMELSTRLCNRHGLVFLADFDAPYSIDAVTLSPLQCHDVQRTKGVFGAAKRLTSGSHLQSENRPSSKLRKNGTLAAWFNPSDVTRKQDLFVFGNFTDKLSLVLEDNRLVLSVSSAGKPEGGTATFIGTPGSFTHVALTFSAEYSAVYQNGRESIRVPTPEGFVIPPRPLVFGVECQNPFEGKIDDLAVWMQQLAPLEVATVAKAKSGLARQCEPRYTALEGLLGFAARFLAGTYRSIDRLFPPLHHNPAPIDKNIPALTFWPSRHDSRHFAAAHSASLLSGFRTKGAAHQRSVDVSFAGKTGKVEVMLDDTYGRDTQKRMAYIVADPSRTLFGGSGVVRLYPPELHTVIHPDAPRPLPVSASFVRLSSGEDFRGLYVIEPFEHPGSAWMARGRRDVGFPDALYYSGLPAPCDLPPEGTDPEEAFRKSASLILSDVLFPWSRQEIAARRRALVRRRRELDFSAPKTSEAFVREIIGDNPSPFYITNNLALDGGERLHWKSSRPDLISSEGVVRRPESGAPVAVTLTPHWDRIGDKAPLHFRVIPEKATLPTFFIYIGSPVEKFKRTDFTCLRVPAGGGSPEWLAGLGATNGGIKHRGNTSYAKGVKRSFSLEFDNKVALAESDVAARHLLLLSGYADPTRLRNKVSFDAYRAANNGTPHGIADISWAEVFINDEYFGVWEICHRVKDIFANATDLYKIRTREPFLWMTTATDMAEVVSRSQPRHLAYKPLEDIFGFTSSVPSGEFAAGLTGKFNLDSVIDFYLMLNFTENRDGLVTNQYIARDDEGRWSVVPWDYDKTFFDDNSTELSNRLISRLLSDYPEFNALLAEKWSRLRAGPMSDEAVLARIDSDVRLIAPYMEYEYGLLQPAGWDGDFAAAVEKLKTVVSARLSLMDRKFGPKGPVLQ